MDWLTRRIEAAANLLLRPDDAACAQMVTALRWRRAYNLRMLASVHSASVIGVDAHSVRVEVDVARGLPDWSIVGLASIAVKEARQRVCAALDNAGSEVPERRTTVNLRPGMCSASVVTACPCPEEVRPDECGAWQGRRE